LQWCGEAPTDQEREHNREAQPYGKSIGFGLLRKTGGLLGVPQGSKKRKFE
jgi:hypothetical protein